MVSDAWVLKLPGFVLLDLEPGMGPKVKAALEKFLISEDAEIGDAGLAELDLWGPRGSEVVRGALGLEAPALGEVRSAGTALVAGAALGPLQGVELYAPRGEVGALREKLLAAGAQPASFEALEVARIEAGVPRFGQDMNEETIPLEANLERAISYSKGCYLGQEVIARVTYRGHVNRKLCSLSLGQNLLPSGTALFAGGKQVGQLTSVARSFLHHEVLGLGTVHRDFTEPGTVLQTKAGVAVSVREPLTGPLPEPRRGERSGPS
jgi:folate-binding protein YgfZ